jgi:DNA polymerase-1
MTTQSNCDLQKQNCQTSSTDAAGNTRTYAYDAGGNLTTESHYINGTALDERIAYSYNDDEQLSSFGLARNLGIDNTAARNYIARYFDRYPGVARYMDDIREQARQQGYVETVFGRRLYLPDIRGGNGPRRAAAERAAINAPMQGTAADLIKMAMVKVQQGLQDERRATCMVMQVHDELIFEVPEAEADWARQIIPAWMAGVAQLKVPLVADAGLGSNWDRAH